jgi:hypothetical protein
MIIYDKGEPLHLENKIILPNVGKKGHTYYQYNFE